MGHIIRGVSLSPMWKRVLSYYEMQCHLFALFLLMLPVMFSHGGVIGNRTVNDWLSSAKRVSLGTVLSIENVKGQSLWRVAITSDYFGGGEDVVDVGWMRELSDSEKAELLGSVGLFAVDHQQRFVARTGSLSVRDVFPRAPARFSSDEEPSIRFCADWLRALAIESNIILRDLAVFSAYCASDRLVGVAVLEELQDDTMDSTAAAMLKSALQIPAGLKELFYISNQLDEKVSGALIENVGWLLLNFRESSPIALEGLARLASESKPFYIRHCAANALVVIHTEASWPHLANLLYSKDNDIRLLAISGLQQIVDAGLDPESPRFEAPILFEGRLVQRQRRTRPHVDDVYRLRESDTVVDNETALLGYWRSYALANQ